MEEDNKSKFLVEIDEDAFKALAEINSFLYELAALNLALTEHLMREQLQQISTLRQKLERLTDND